MKCLSPLPWLVCILLANAAVPTTQANAAFLVEAHNSGKANATNFAIISGAGNATGASTSVVSDAVGTTATNSIFGSNNTVAGVLDTYRFSYTPGIDADNTVFAAGTVLGSKGGFPGDGNRATGLTGGLTELYNVYFTTNSSLNVSAAGSNFTITQDGAPIVLPFVNLNNTGTGSDTNPDEGSGAGFVGGVNHAWKLLGTVRLTAGTTYTVTQTSNADSFVSQRAHGVMWELTPEPSLGIFTWEYIASNDPGLGKRQSTTIAPDGGGVNAVPFANLSSRNLTMAYLTGADLSDANLSNSNLTVAEMSQADLAKSNLSRANLGQTNLTAADLTSANLTGANLTDAVLTDAIITKTKLSSTHITLGQLYSTASYKNQDLAGVQFVGNDLSGANFVNQDLAAASFYAAKLIGASLANANLSDAELVNADLSDANLTGANFTYGTLALANLSGANLKNANFSGTNLIGANFRGADIRGASLSKLISAGGGSDGRPCGCGIFWWPTPQPNPTDFVAGSGITLAQLVSTASYAARDLAGVTFINNNFAGGNFAGFNLTNTNFYGTTLVDTDFSGADARGAVNLYISSATNFIHPDGHIAGVNISAGQALSIRDYDGSSTSGVLPIRVDEQLTMAQDATLQMIFDADAWDSTISFAAGIPVTLSGNLLLALTDGVDPLSQIGRTFQIFDWTGVTRNGTFAIDSPYIWDTSQLYSTGQITFLAAGSAAFASAVPVIPEPSACWLLCTGLATALAPRRTRPNQALIVALALLAIPSSFSFAARPDIQLTQIGAPIWKPADFQLFSAPATPFAESAAHIFDTILPNDDFNAYTPHSGPYETELSTGALAGGYVTKSLFPPEAISLNPNGLYFIYMLVPQPGVNGDSRDFESGPVIPNSLFPLLNNLDVWLDGVLVDRTPGADAVINVQQPDVDNIGISHLEVMQAIWHPWDDDLSVGPLGRYDLRTSMRDASGSGWEAVVPFRVALPGDYDYGGTVGPEDYGVWKAKFGSTTNLDADGNDDHIINAADYTIWRDNFGNSLGTGSGSAAPSAAPLSGGVPEPHSAVLLILAAAGWRLWQRPIGK